MNQSKQFKIATVLIGMLLLVVVGVLSFFIVHNAQWLIGDDAIIINRTGWDIPFTVWDTIKPEIGRFFPLAYMHENIVLLFPGDIHSATQHYVVNLILFILLTFMLAFALWKVVKPSNILDLVVIFLAIILCITRLYGIYINVFSSIYQYYTLTAILIVCFIQYYNTKNNIYGIFTLILTIYTVFCGENVFVIPLSIGVVTLLLGKNKLTKQNILFNIGLISIAIAFLLIYFFGIFLKVDAGSLYSPSHGSDTTFLENAVFILKGQKFLVFSALLWIYRQYVIIRKKDQFNVLYDSLLWTAGAILLGGFILKLNWQMYYYTSILYALPAIVYFCYKHFGRVFCLMIIMLFAGLHSLKIPSYIRNNQETRKNTVEIITKVSNEIKSGRDVVWYETEGKCLAQNELDRRSWIKWCTKSCIQHQLQIRNWNYSTDNYRKDCVLLCPIENIKCEDGFVCDETGPDAIIANILVYYNYAYKNENPIQ